MKSSRKFLKNFMFMVLIAALLLSSGCKKDISVPDEKTPKSETASANISSQDDTSTIEGTASTTEIDTSTVDTTNSPSTDTETNRTSSSTNGIFSFSHFTDYATANLDKVYSAGDLLSDEPYYMTLMGSMLSLSTALLPIANVELEYIMELKEGEWTDQQFEWPNGQGSSLTSYKKEGALLTYTKKDTYKDNNQYNLETCIFDSQKDRMDLINQYYDNDQKITKSIHTQFASDGSGNYYFQELTLKFTDNKEACIAFYLTKDSSDILIGSRSNVSASTTLNIDLMSTLPTDLNSLIKGFEPLQEIHEYNNELTIKGIE